MERIRQLAPAINDNKAILYPYDLPSASHEKRFDIQRGDHVKAGI